MKKGSQYQSQLMDVFIGIAQATRCCRKDTAFCGGVTFHQFVILDAVSKNKELKISDLHALLAVEKSTTTRLLNPLLTKGLLNKERSENDSRASVLTLTKKGRTTHKQVHGCLEDFFSKIESHLPDSEKDTVLPAVQTFLAAIKKASGACDCRG